MAHTLRISNIPTYIQDADFKQIFSQLDCLSCNLVKGGPAGEIIGYARFGTPQAANHALQTYQGWQGFGGGDGLRIAAMNDDQGPVKRGREDVGREDPVFKQSRLMGGGTLGYAAGPGYQGYGQEAGRQPDPYNQPQPNAGPGSGGGGYGGAAQLNPQYGRQTGQQDFQGIPPVVDSRAQANLNPAASRPMSQGYYSGVNPPRDMQLVGSQAQQQAPMQGQNPVGAAPNGIYGNNPGLQQIPHQGIPQNQGIQPLNQQPAQFQQPQGIAQQGAPYGVQQPVQQGNFGSFGGPESYDPQKPQLEGSQQLNQPLQQNNQQNNSVANLAAVLGPLLQQSGGLQNLQGLLSGQNQGKPIVAPQANLNPAAQINQMDPRGATQMPGNIQQPMQMQPRPQIQPQTLPQPQGQPFNPQLEQLAPEASPTLYVDGMALDVTKREMSHIFRPFEGFKEMRMVEKKDKNGKPLLIAFTEFETPHQAAASMKTLQDYPLDLSLPTENRLRLSFAKPLKSTDPRARAGRPFQPPANDNFRAPRGERGGRDDQRDRRDRDRDRRGGRDDRVRFGGPDRRK